MLLYALSKIDTAPAKENRIISQIVSLTDEGFINFDLSLENISKELGYNPKYISHLFKEKMGIGYSAYLQNRRIEYAITLFDHGIDSVKNVASLSGFRDPYYFSTVFKKHVGVSPKYYKGKETNI